MISVNILEADDIIHPDDYYRPLMRSADFSQSDSWLRRSCYGGGPLDHLRWAPVWLILGRVWWGKRYARYMDVASRPFEAVRGNVPKENILDLTEWKYRHPLAYEEFKANKREILSRRFRCGKYRGRTIKDVLKTHLDGVAYLNWYASKVEPEWADDVEDLKNESLYKAYYNPVYKKFHAT